jgi:hypothetical protein
LRCQAFVFLSRKEILRLLRESARLQELEVVDFICTSKDFAEDEHTLCVNYVLSYNKSIVANATLLVWIDGLKQESRDVSVKLLDAFLKFFDFLSQIWVVEFAELILKIGG